MRHITADRDGFTQITHVAISDDLADVKPKWAFDFRIEGGIHEYGGETGAIAPKQFIIKTLAKVSVGSRLMLKVRVPAEVPGVPSAEVGLTGRVKRGRSSATAGSRMKSQRNCAEKRELCRERFDAGPSAPVCQSKI